MIEVRMRRTAERLVDPVGRVLARAGVTPAGVTLAGLVVTLIGAVLVALGWLAIGSWVVIVGTIIDSLDGAVARASGRVTDRGSFIDSVADRVGETGMWAALAYAQPDQPVPVLAVLVLGGSLLTSYLRAKAESVGLDGTGGVFGRAERVILYSVGLTFPTVLLPTLWVLLVGTWATVAYRFSINWRQLRG